MSQVPDFMPVLSFGSHKDPKDGACVMEYVSILAGEPFSDKPACTDHRLASVAWMVNDGLADEDRHRLLPFIPRLIGTANILETYSEGPPFGNAAEFWTRCKEAGNKLSTAYLKNPGGHPDALIEYLDDVLTAFEEITGHQPGPDLDNTVLTELAAVTRKETHASL